MIWPFCLRSTRPEGAAVDGKLIYFASRRTGRLEIFRMPAGGGEAFQMTRQGGFRPSGSLDGKLVYYEKDNADFDVWKVPAAGGEEIKVFGPTSGEGFAVTAKGIYFTEIGTRMYVGSKGSSLKFFSFATGASEKIADIKLNPQLGLSVSPDGRYVLVRLGDPTVCDLMLVENFR